MENPIYKNPNEPIESRIKDLLSRMTVKEKIGQMTQIERSVATPSVVKDLCIGSVLSCGGFGPFEEATASNWADMVDSFQKSALDSRLGIPILYGINALHGNNNVYGATVFPHNVGLGATRDADLVRRIGEVTAIEVCRDPRWGRCYESFSEDTQTVRKMTSMVTGLQGQPPEGYPKNYPFVGGRTNVVACAKHFVGDGGTEKGVDAGNTKLSYEDLERIHMAPYVDCISQGVCTVMASYSSWNGTKLHESHFLLTETLKEKLGFKLYLEELTHLVETGEIPISRIDDAVERVLRVKFVAGLFEYPFSDKALLDSVGCKRHRGIAREAVRKSLVLLKNGKDPKKPFLPLDRYAKRILVAGAHADDLGYQCTTILDAVKETVGDKTEVIYHQNPSPETLDNQDFSFAIVVVGETPYVEAMGDNSELTIPLDGDKLITSVASRLPTLVILISGRPLVLEPEVFGNTDAFVAAWLPGSEGGGITDVIFGDYEFEGRLPMMWFRRVEQLPTSAEENSYDPLFPFGFGLKSKQVSL
ncbi:Glycoside hydrolase family 3 [Cynara cardunculus var. scolymus]|uniref:Glycoside hydrolase family 3 n=1 Tax=Cynara cardunculus var. scolymus TaxID=59895 RepID=A0A103XPS8_CYNCS|nr:Glycoside hydrolase family 3 [Cynara cardunculus var. scolymus]